MVFVCLQYGPLTSIPLNVGADEQRFLEASMAYVSGNPILTDKEFDKLKLKLKVLYHWSIIFLY